MCSGNLTIYSCGHESRHYFYRCDDATNKHYQALLPHRMVGQELQSTGLCAGCQRDRAARERSERRSRPADEARAKAVLEFLREERPWPRANDEMRENFENAYREDRRLHPWLNRGSEPDLDSFRASLIEHFPATGAALFRELLDRQAEIDRTGVTLPSDTELGLYITVTLIAAEEASRGRLAEQMTRPLELWDGSQNLEEPRQGDHLVGQEQVAAPIEQLDGLCESDPSWLLNFDDWTREVGNLDNIFVFNGEIELRRDINGWFQHLRTCESQARLEWIPFAEAYRNAVLAGSRWSYDYNPSVPDETGWLALSFRNWCLQNADLAEIQVSPINSVFINLIQGYREYLVSTESYTDAEQFLCDRSGRMTIIREHLAAIPGSPFSTNRPAPSTTEESPSDLQMRMDIRRLLTEGGFITSVGIQDPPAQLDSVDDLTSEAHEADEDRLPGFGIEGDERAARDRREQERQRLEREADTDSDEQGYFDVIYDEDADLFITQLPQRRYNIRCRAAREREQLEREADTESDEGGYSDVDYDEDAD